MIWLAAAGTLLAVAVAVRLPPPRRSLGPDRRLADQRAGEQDSPGPGPPAADPTGSPRAMRLAGILAGIACGVLVGSPVGIVVGLVVAAGVSAALGRLETAAHRAERLAVTADAPLLADLLAAALAAGVPLERATGVVARAVGGPLEPRLLRVDALVRLGQPAASAWGELGTEPAAAALVACVGRSTRTGAPLADLLTAVASDLRHSARAAARAEIRAASVRAVLPLGLCLLPAFVLLGIAPIVGGLLRGF